MSDVSNFKTSDEFKTMTYGIFIFLFLAVPIVGQYLFLHRRRCLILQRLAQRLGGHFKVKGSIWSLKGYYVQGSCGFYDATLLIDLVRDTQIGGGRAPIHVFTFKLRHGTKFQCMQITPKGLVANLLNMAGVPTGQDFGRNSIDSKYNVYGNLDELNHFLKPSAEKHLHEIFKLNVDELVVKGFTIKVNATDLFYNEEAFFNLFQSLTGLAKVHDKQAVKQS